MEVTLHSGTYLLFLSSGRERIRFQINGIDEVGFDLLIILKAFS